MRHIPNTSYGGSRPMKVRIRQLKRVEQTSSLWYIDLRPMCSKLLSSGRRLLSGEILLSNVLLSRSGICSDHPWHDVLHRAMGQ